MFRLVCVCTLWSFSAFFQCSAMSVKNQLDILVCVFFSVEFSRFHVNLTFCYNPFSQATSRCKTQIFLKFCRKERGGSRGSLLPPVYRDLSCPQRWQLLSAPLLPAFPPALPQREPQKQPSYLLPTALWDKDGGMCFSRASSSARCCHRPPHQPQPGSDRTSSGRPWKESRTSQSFSQD